ncbi:MAG: hypothetical protein EA376_03080 [Phycisphaeraceae bacterium]|nr:MAG: hypothetical protein EA376_03080 [Phycisphaeraceae bacterium]
MMRSVSQTVRRAVGIGAVGAGLLGGGCAGVHDRRDPVGETFPTVSGVGLDDRAWTIPADLAGEPALLLIGYRQSSQFDIDRWLLGLHQAEIEVRALELPTIPGFLPRLFRRSIDSGMRSGIPAEDWGAVVTVYRDGGQIASFTGNRNGLPARVLLLDGEGVVRYFHDEGYSVGALERMAKALDAVRGEGGGEQADPG